MERMKQTAHEFCQISLISIHFVYKENQILPKKPHDKFLFEYQNISYEDYLKL